MGTVFNILTGSIIFIFFYFVSIACGHRTPFIEGCET
jgi:hypothetical protein